MGHRLISRSTTGYTPPPDTRPRPIADAADAVGTWTAAVIPILTALVGYGVVSLSTADAITGLLGLLPGLVAAVTAVLTATGIIRRAEPEVTPLSSPRSASGKHLRPAPPVTAVPDTGPNLASSSDDGWWARGGIAYGTGLTTADSDVYENADPADGTVDQHDDRDDHGDREYHSEQGDNTERGRVYDQVTFLDGRGDVIDDQRVADALEQLDQSAAQDLAPAAGTSPTPDATSAPQTHAGSYTPPDTYPVASSPDSGHHSPSGGHSDTSGGGWSDTGGSSSSDSSGGGW